MIKLIAVLAGDVDQFKRFIRDIDINDAEKFRFVENRQAARGVEFSNVIKVGTYWRNPDNRELETLIKQRIGV